MFSEKNMRNLKILGATIVTRSKFHIEKVQILGATVNSLVAMVTLGENLCTPTLYLLFHKSYV